MVCKMKITLRPQTFWCQQGLSGRWARKKWVHASLRHSDPGLEWKWSGENHITKLFTKTEMEWYSILQSALILWGLSIWGVVGGGGGGGGGWQWKLVLILVLSCDTASGVTVSVLYFAYWSTPEASSLAGASSSTCFWTQSTEYL